MPHPFVAFVVRFLVYEKISKFIKTVTLFNIQYGLNITKLIERGKVKWNRSYKKLYRK